MVDTIETVKKPLEAAAETVKTQTAKVQASAQQAQAAGAQAFREATDKSVASMTELNAHGKKNLEALVASATATQRGVEALSSQSLAYGKKSWEDGVAAAQTIAQARSVQELVELQTSFAKTAMETYMAELTKMTDVLTASVKDSFKPINERVTASVEKFQAAR